MLQDIPIPTPALREAQQLRPRDRTADVAPADARGRKGDCASRQRSPHRGKYPPPAAPLSAGPRRRIRARGVRRRQRDRIPDRTELFARRHGRHRPQRTDAPELGYWLGVAHWGQGFGTEAARAAIDFFFEEFDLEHLISGARVANPASRNILEKCGFQWSGVELHRFEALGSSTPVDRFRLTRGVWSSLKNWGSSTRRER